MTFFISALWAESTLRSCALRSAVIFWLMAGALAGAAPGGLDLTFGSGFGKVITAVGSSSDYAAGVALQPDGKIVVAGTCYTNGYADFCVARYLASGALDTTFNTTGTVITPISSERDRATALALQPDGKIVVAGYCGDEDYYDFCLARYLDNGSLDTSFNGTGKVITPIGRDADYTSAIAIQPDGKIVVAGVCLGAGSIDFCLARYLANGALDTTFGGAGIVITPIGTRTDELTSIALQPDGKIVAAGHCMDGVNVDFCLARYLDNGALDTSFNGTGKVITLMTVGYDRATSLAIDTEGVIVVAGGCYTGINFDFCVANYLPNGTLDTRFNNTGKVFSSIGGSDDTIFSVVLQPDRKIVVSGSCATAGNQDFCLARYTVIGTLDTTFNGTGKVITPINNSADWASAMALQSDGNIVVAGYCFNGANDDFCLARYEGEPYTVKKCSFDIDGDGSVRATTDMLVGTRVALGMTGNAVISGINFPSNATRTTWTQIRNFLIGQCAMTVGQ